MITKISSRGMFAWALTAPFLIFAFNNCAPTMTPYEQVGLLSSASVAKLTACEEELFTVFTAKVSPFVKTNCSTCHADGGISGAFFSSADAKTGFFAFQNAGVDKWQQYALGNHQPGITGSQHTEVVNDAVTSWTQVEAGATCSNETPVSLAAVTTDKVMAATATNKVIVWELDTESDRMGEFKGARFSIGVRIVTMPNSMPAYYFSLPQIRGPTDTTALGIAVRGLTIRINGVRYDLGTTYVESSGYAAPNVVTNLSTATMIKQMPVISAADTIGIEFQSIEVRAP